jgi:hypothetical protein
MASSAAVKSVPRTVPDSASAGTKLDAIPLSGYSSKTFEVGLRRPDDRHVPPSTRRPAQRKLRPWRNDSREAHDARRLCLLPTGSPPTTRADDARAGRSAAASRRELRLDRARRPVARGARRPAQALRPARARRRGRGARAPAPEGGELRRLPLPRVPDGVA